MPTRCQADTRLEENAYAQGAHDALEAAARKIDEYIRPKINRRRNCCDDYALDQLVQARHAICALEAGLVGDDNG